MHPIAIVRRASGGRTYKIVDQGGAVFMGSPKQGVTTPVFFMGIGEKKEPVFTCPVSAIPRAAWELLDLYFQCRAMKALPFAGGVLDQPLIVRRAFPVFEIEQMAVDRLSQAHVQAHGAATVLGAMFGAGGGGRRGK